MVSISCLMRRSELASQSPADVFDALPSTSSRFAVGVRPMPTLPAPSTTMRVVLPLVRSCKP